MKGRISKSYRILFKVYYPFLSCIFMPKCGANIFDNCFNTIFLTTLDFCLKFFLFTACFANFLYAFSTVINFVCVRRHKEKMLGHCLTELQWRDFLTFTVRQGEHCRTKSWKIGCCSTTFSVIWIRNQKAKNAGILPRIT